jgi:hypothetical protein
VPKKRRPTARAPAAEDEWEPDLEELEDVEEWVARRLRDWQLESSVVLLEKLTEILDNEITIAETRRAALAKDDLRGDGYLAGQVNAWETMRNQVRQAAHARRSKIGTGKGPK